MPKKKEKEKPRARYGDYCTEKDGKLYGVVRLRRSDGTYQRKIKLVSNRTEARRWALDELADHNRGNTFNADLTFTEMAAWFAKEYLHPPILEKGVKVSGTKDYKRSKNKLAVFAAFWKSKRAADFSETDLRHWQSFRRKENPDVTQTTLNRDFELLRTVFRAAKRNKKIKEVPDFGIIKNSAENARDRVLTFEEEERLLSKCVDVETVEFTRLGKKYKADFKVGRSHLRPIIIMAVDTAMRAGEIFTLTWENIDLENRIVTVEARFSKTQRSRKVPITDRLLDELNKMEPKTGKVFSHNRPPVCFVTACDKAGIKDLTFHDLRHTATTRLINAGIPYGEVMKITGHTEIKTFLRYLNPTDQTIKSVAERFSEFLKKNT
jgi:integrase